MLLLKTHSSWEHLRAVSAITLGTFLRVLSAVEITQEAPQVSQGWVIVCTYTTKITGQSKQSTELEIQEKPCIQIFKSFSLITHFFTWAIVETEPANHALWNS